MKIIITALLCVWCAGLYGQDMTADSEVFISTQLPAWFEFYRDLHATPELSFYEKETSAKMAQALRKEGFEVTEDFGGHGVVGVFKNGQGPTVMVRADMDALPVVEDTGLPYASKTLVNDENGNQVGVMHACGHDLHMTVWSGTAQLLSDLKDQWKGTLVFIAQPAEERTGGAQAMLTAGLFEKFPRPDYILALHTSANLASGKVGYVSGFAMANVDFMKITIFGEGGHGAYPHTTKDPVVLAAKTILDLQTIISREVSPLDPAVVTVGSIHGGTKANIIPDEVKLELTMRSYSDEVREDIIKKIRRICLGNAISAGLSEDKYPQITLRTNSTPALYNDPELTEELAQVIANRLGDEHVEKVAPVMAGEDFARYGRVEPKIPLFLFWLGSVSPEKIKAAEAGELKLPSLHSSKFAPEAEPAIETGVKTMSAAVLHLLGK